MSGVVLPPKPHKIRFRMPYDHPSPEFVAGLRALQDEEWAIAGGDFFGLADRAGVKPETLLGWHCTQAPTFRQMVFLCEEVLEVRVADFWAIGTERYDAEIGPLRDAVRRGLAFHEWSASPPGRLLPSAIAESKLAAWSAPYQRESRRILADVRTHGTLSFSMLQGGRIMLTAERKTGRGRGHSYRYTVHLPSATGEMRPVDLGSRMRAGEVLDALTAQLQVSAYDAARESLEESERERIPLFVDLGLVTPPGDSGTPGSTTPCPT